MSGTEWLSEGAERFLVDYWRNGAESLPVLDLVIVGSGYGGAVAAARLASHTHDGKPLEVFVFERGKEYVPGDFPERFAEMPGHVRINDDEHPLTRGHRDGLFDVRAGKEISALMGNGLGGGSLINAGVMAEPTEQVFEKCWPTALSNRGALSAHYKAVRDMLSVRKFPLPEDPRSAASLKPAKLAALEQVGKLLDGKDSDRRADIAVTFEAGVNQSGVAQKACIQCGDCFTGCNHWAKNTLAMNYLPYAKSRGVRLVTGITVASIERDGDGWSLKVTLTNKVLADKHMGTGMSIDSPINYVKIKAKRVILSAGTYGSTEIMLRSAEALRASPMVGQRFSTNGDMIAAGFRMRPTVNASPRENQPPSERKVGPTITGMVDLRDGVDLAKQIAIEEMAVPAALRRVLEETVTNLDSLHSLTRCNRARHDQNLQGQDPAGIDPNAIEHTALYAIMGHDEALASMELVKKTDPNQRSMLPAPTTSADDVLRVTQGKSKQLVADHPVFRLGIERLRVAHADPAIGGTLLPNPLWDPWPEELVQMFDTTPNRGAALTVHPLGGCAMADTRNEGVVNHLGQVFRNDPGTAADAVYDTLVILDGSIIPTSLGINPALTIAAVAERAVDGLKQVWGFHPASSSTQAQLSPPPRHGAWRENIQTKPTGFRFSEKLCSERLKFPMDPGAPIRGELRLDFLPVDDMEAFLATLPKVLKVDQACLRVTRAGAKDLEVPLTGFMSVLELENSVPWQRALRATVAWLLNRGFQEIWKYAKDRLQASHTTVGHAAEPSVSLWQRTKQLFIMASHVGERRRYRYELTVARDVESDGRRYFGKGDRLLGEKLIAYTYRGNPWDQWMDMKLHLLRAGDTRRDYLGEMSVDLPHYVRKHAIQLQLTAQDSQPQAIADLISFATFTARTIARIHLWTFRLPDYPASLAATSAKTDAEVHRTQFKRLPGPVGGVTPEPFEPTDVGQYLLHRYTPANHRPELGPVVLIHGFGASGSSFTLPTVEQNLVGHLIERGFDTWVLDLRTSIALESSHQPTFFETVAFYDIPPAIRQIQKACGEQQVSVVAHCIGSAMFCMAALSGKLPKDCIRGAVLSQMAPLVHVTPLNLFRGFVAGYVRFLLNMDEFDVTHPRSDWMDFIDRILTSYPYPKKEWRFHHSLRPCSRIEHEVFCNRASAIYNPLFEHGNVNERTLASFGDLIGHVNLQTYLQTIHFAKEGRITDQLGRNVFVTPHNLAKHLRFPIFFLHGEENRLFKVETSRKSFDLMASVFKGATTTYEDGSLSHGPFRFRSIKGYGHQDCIIGDNASADVFPSLSEFLSNPPSSSFEERSKRSTLRPARLGPVLAWARRVDGKRRVALWFVPDDRVSAPTHAVTMVCRGTTLENALPKSCQRHALTALNIEGQAPPPPRVIEVDLPPGDELSVVVMTLHSEHVQDESQGDAFLSVPESDELMRSGNDLRKLCDQLLMVANQRQMQFDTCADERSVDEHYEHQPCSVFLSKDVLRAIDADPASVPESFTFAAGSCRYAANAFDRELADQSFGRIRRRLEHEHAAGDRPQMLLMLGDQIYADATAGLFDPQSPIDRYDNQYAEAWSAPNLRQVLRRVPTYMMLDDHEIQENYESSTPNSIVKEALPTFRAYQLLGAPPNPLGRGSNLKKPYRHWYSFENGGYPFFVLDTRTERSHALTREQGVDDVMLQDEQWKHLEKWLLAHSQTRPKFIVSPSVVAPWSKTSKGSPANALRADGWDGLPHSLNRLLAFIARNTIQNVIFVSGDYHCSMLCEMTLSMGARSVRALSIVTSGLYAPYPFANGTTDEFELDFLGVHEQWVDPDNEGARPLEPVMIQYRTRRESFITAQSVGVISVQPTQGGSWKIAVEFDTHNGVVRDEVAL